MADNDKTTNVEQEKSKTPSAIKKIANAIQTNLDALYSKTYFTSPDNKNDLYITTSNINKAIDKIISNNINASGLPNISSFFTRVDAIQKDDKTLKKISDIFNDKGIMDSFVLSYTQNKYLKDLDDEIDTILKYCPKLLEALEIRKDNVLSADHFTKDFLNISDKTNAHEKNKFQTRCQDIKKKYDLLNQIDLWYDKAAKYGEVFVYIAPYKQALAKLMRQKDGLNVNPSSNDIINSIDNESSMIIKESVIIPTAQIVHKSGNEQIPDNINIQLELNKSGILYEEVQNIYRYINLKPICESQSLNNEVQQIISESAKTKQKFDKINDYAEKLKRNEDNKKNKNEVPVDLKSKRTVDKGIIDVNSNLDYKDFEDRTSSDGLITDFSDDNRDKKKEAEYNFKNIGCIVKELDRYNIIPLYINNMCLGYYYFEFRFNNDYAITTQLSDPAISMKKATKLYNDQEYMKQNSFLKAISAKIAAKIDANFVNANQDLTKEIYMVLKHNDTYNATLPEGIKVTFIPAEDVEHIYFKMNDKTHRGISDIEAAMFPAKLYAGLYITNVIAIMTRGQDRRVFKVRQTIDSNIAASLLTVIEQIKKYNFNVRQIENINQVLNIIGRFNDFVIPVGPNGEAPIDMEVMQGQQIEVQTEFMTKLEEMAVNATDVPLELISIRHSIEYASQLTMTNSKFLRKIYTRQGKYQQNLSRIFTKIYCAEYLENVNIQVTLPPPIFLNITNTDQLANNIMNLSQTIADIVCPDGDPDPDAPLVKATVLSKIKRSKLESFVDFAEVDRLVNEARQDVAQQKEKLVAQQEQ